MAADLGPEHQGGRRRRFWGWGGKNGSGLLRMFPFPPDFPIQQLCGVCAYLMRPLPQCNFRRKRIWADCHDERFCLLLAHSSCTWRSISCQSASDCVSPDSCVRACACLTNMLKGMNDCCFSQTDSSAELEHSCRPAHGRKM